MRLGMGMLVSHLKNLASANKAQTSQYHMLVALLRYDLLQSNGRLLLNTSFVSLKRSWVQQLVDETDSGILSV